MKGSVVAKKTGKKIKYYIVVDLPKAPGEKRKQKWFGSWEKKRDAEAALPEYLLKVQPKNYVAAHSVTLEKITNEYLLRNQHALAKSTLRRYTFCTKQIVAELGPYKVCELEPYLVEQYFDKLRERGLKPTTIAKHKTVLNQIFSYAKELRIIDQTPMPCLKVKGRNLHNFETWNSTEIWNFLNCVKGESIYIPVLIAATTGMRLGEVIALKWKDVDFKKGVITVRKSKDVDNTLKSPKNNASRRAIHVMHEPLAILEAHKLEQKKNRIRFGTEYQLSDFVCTLDDGTPIKANYVSIMFKRKVDQYNFTPIRFHDLRHSFATISLSNNVHPKVVQEILGHSTIRTTLETYSHVLPTVHQDSMAAIEKAFSI